MSTAQQQYQSTHRAAERRSLRYHRAIAEALTADSGIIERARERVAAWQQGDFVHRDYVLAWANLLSRPPVEIAAQITDDDERTRALRQVSPFAGALSPRQRWQLWRHADNAA